MTAPVSILLCEDHQIVRQGLVALLGDIPDLVVADTAADGRQAIALAEALAPDVVLMDLSLPEVSGFEAIAEIRRRAPGTGVVVLSMHDDATAVDRALRAGARGYVLKGETIEHVVDAVREVAKGGSYFSQGVSRLVLHGYLDGPETQALTPRERELLALIAEGLTSAEIAERLGLKTKTVQNQRSLLMDKLDIRTTAGLVRYAMRAGLLR